jgi:hypothetical protein
MVDRPGRPWTRGLYFLHGFLPSGRHHREQSHGNDERDRVRGQYSPPLLRFRDHTGQVLRVRDQSALARVALVDARARATSPHESVLTGGRNGSIVPIVQRASPWEASQGLSFWCLVAGRVVCFWSADLPVGVPLCGLELVDGSVMGTRGRPGKDRAIVRRIGRTVQASPSQEGSTG